MSNYLFLLQSMFLILFFSVQSFAIVDMRNANFSESWIDLQVKSSSYDLRVQRTYNSRTLFKGMFGFGWCSDFETTLKVTAENTLRVTECGAGFEVDFSPATSDSNKNLENHIRTLMTEYRNRNKNKLPEQYKSIETSLRIDPALREEFSQQFNIISTVKENTRYAANGKTNDTIVFKNNIYVRSLPNGTTQKFNKDGHLIQVNDQNNNFIKILYSDNKISTITEAGSASFKFKYNSNSKFVKQIIGPNGLSASYKYSGENLVSVTNAWKNTYIYYYDDLYNMTKATYPDKTYIAIDYNKDKDWVVQFRDRMGCVESYEYTDAEKDPVNNYKSAVKKVCNSKVTNVSSYEFWHKTRADGVRYLHRTLAINNNQSVDTTYHEIFGRPTVIKNNNEILRFEYSPQGQMLKKSSPTVVHSFKYNELCNKVSQVVVMSTPNASNAGANRDRKPTTNNEVSQRSTTNFLYDSKKCNLLSAKNSSGQTVALSYDFKGRIIKILDQSKKIVTITYEERFGKPHIVNRPGLGSIRFKYKSDGSVDKFDSPDDSVVAVQVASIFSNLLEIISPATTDTNNI